MNLILPSAKLIPAELQKISRIPPALYPLEQGTVLDQLLLLYGTAADKTIVVGYESFELLRACAERYKARHVNFVRLNELRDLGYSVWFGLRECNLSEPVIINFADTIVQDVRDAGTAICQDAFYCAEASVGDRWTFYVLQDGVITKIIDKRETMWCGARGTLFTGVFILLHPQDFLECLEHALSSERHMDSFYAALTRYSQKHPLTPIPAKNWFDVGHSENYARTKIAVQARVFNHISIDEKRGILRKTSDNAAKLIDEIEWYLKLPSDIEYTRPRIFDFSLDYRSPYVEMEYYAYHTLHEMYLYGELSISAWRRVFDRVRFVLLDMARYQVKGNGILAAMKEMYLDKTIERLSCLQKQHAFEAMFNSPFTVNSICYKPINEIVKVLESTIPDRLYGVDCFNIIHGDLCFSNIMIDNNLEFIKLIDPRGKFGAFDLYGDSRYELAKLFHCVDGKYDYIIKDLFDVSYTANRIDYRIHGNSGDDDIFRCLIDCFQNEIGEHLEEITLIESLLFLSMIPLHTESVNQQMVMLGKSMELMNSVIDIREG